MDADFSKVQMTADCTSMQHNSLSGKDTSPLEAV